MQKKLQHPLHAGAENLLLNPLNLLPGATFSMSFRMLCVARICRQRVTLFCHTNFDLEPHLVLILLAAGERHLHQGILAKSLGIDKNAIVFQIDKLEERGLIKRIPNPDNRRARLIECTPKGRDVIADIKVSYPEIVRWVLYPLSSDQTEQFGALLLQIIEGETAAKQPVLILPSNRH